MTPGQAVIVLQRAAGGASVARPELVKPLDELAREVAAGRVDVSDFPMPSPSTELTAAIRWAEPRGLLRVGRSADVNAALAVGGTLVVAAVGGAFLVRALDWVRRPKPEKKSSGDVRTVPRTPAPVPVAVVWAGPINAKQVEGADLSGVPTSFVSCTGDGKPSCGEIADKWLDGAGRRLPGLRRALKLPPGPVVLAGFSAGGHLIRRVLEAQEDRAEVAAVVLADATYTTGWSNRAEKKAAPIESFVRYAREAGAAGHLFVATASAAPNKEYPTGAQTLAAIAVAAGAVPIASRNDSAGMPQPLRSWQLPGAVFLDFDASYSHEAHATALARMTWEAFVRPFFQGAVT